MLILLRLLQSLIQTLHSDGTPGQVAAGLTLGAALGLTPLLSPHNLVVISAIALLNVSVGGAVIGMLLFTPAGFLLDPVFDYLGAMLLGLPWLQGVWTAVYNTPVLALSNFNNTIVLGSIVCWAILTLPIYVGSRAGVVHYRGTLGVMVRNSKYYKAIAASRVMTVYRLLVPE